ncbi:MAG: hypothetical protein IPO83_12450 [Chitinophagaceae bacterium]|nr:hypothetical protein [Chitinophagaceae bacterium]
MFLKICFGLLITSLIPCCSFSQEILFSAPQKVTTGYARVDVLGKNLQGTIVHALGRNTDEMIAFYDNMQLRWKKATPKKEKNAKLEQIVLYEDSIIFFYSIIVKNVTLLKAFRTNAKLEPGPLSYIVDTINRTLVNAAPDLHFAFNPDKSKILIYYQDAAFNSNDLLHARCYNFHLHKFWSSSWKIKSMEIPILIEAVVDTQGNASVVVGESYTKNFNNDFTFSGLHVFHIKAKGQHLSETEFFEKNHLLTPCKVKIDLSSGKLLMAGLYASAAGVESEGAYFFVLRENDSLPAKKFEPHSLDFISQLTGNKPPRKNDGFFEFQPKELIVTRDGGGILITEAISVSSESFNNSGYGTFGISSGFTVNYYHYDELAVFSFNDDLSLNWKQILHKKQATEGDGGYYSSFATVISPAALHFIYNDVQNGQTSVGGYNIDVTGKQQHVEVFNADRKGVMIIPQAAKQVAPNEVVVPSLKRNYLQFVKIIF